MIGDPKHPADRNQRLRDLARDEECTVRLPAGPCDPRTTVWGHTNTQADQKGLGYKGHDSAGFFTCYRCHCALDQPSGRGALSGDERDYYVAFAQAATTRRLLEIAQSPTMRPWKVAIARWALERRTA